MADEVLSGLPSQGTLLNVLMGSPLAYKPIPNLQDWSPMPATAMLVDTSSHSSTPWDTNVPTMLSAGKITAPWNYIPGNEVHEQLITYFKQRGSSATQPGVPIKFRTDFVDANQTTHKWEGFITGIKTDAPVKGVYKGSLDIQIVGEPDYAADRDQTP